MFIHVKRIIAIFMLFLGVLMPLLSIAQVRPQRMSQEKQIENLKSKLKLNNEQTKKIKFVLEDQREELGIAMNDKRGDSRATDEAAQEIMKNTDNKIKAILTEKQAEIYDKIVEEREARANRQEKEQ
jgi:hypothetical protein